MNYSYKKQKKIVNSLKEIWNYMRLNNQLEKCDLIIGCGCSNLEIPIKCANLFKEGYAPKILFCGGLGKMTKNYFNKSEAEIYKDIAIKEGISETDILIETNSTNTGDNFRFALDILNQTNLKTNKIIIVHGPLSERRTLSSAKAILKDKKLLITSPDISFEEFLEYLEKNKEQALDIISVAVGDIQRMIIFPQLGWQIENEVPYSVIESYKYLKTIGFNKYVLTKKQIQSLIDTYGIIEGQTKNYFN